MTSRTGFIDFFVLEAAEYIDQLDGLLQQAPASAPNGEAMQRAGRALRGVATMAKLPAFANLAAAVEGIARATRDDVIEWTPALRAAMTSAIDDLKILLRAARNWGDAEIARAAARTRELIEFAPAPRRSSGGPGVVASPAYLIGEANNIAAGLELLSARPENRAAAGAVLGRVRALRGVAGIKDLPPLAEVTEAAEAAAQPLEHGDSRLSVERMDLLRAAAAVLRRIAAAIRDGKPTNTPSAEYDQYVAAAAAFENSDEDGAIIVPVHTLFYDDDGPTVVTRAPDPPTTPRQRFRMEAVSLAEHLRALVAVARATADPEARERVRRDLGRGLRAIRLAAESFGEQPAVQFILAHADAADAVDEQSLATIERIVQTIAYADAPVSSSAPTPFAGMPVIRPTPAAPSPAVPRRATPVRPATAVPPRTTPVMPAAAVPPRTTPVMPAPAVPPRTTPVMPAAAVPPRTTPVMPAAAVPPRTTPVMPAAAVPPRTTPVMSAPAVAPRLTPVMPIDAVAAQPMQPVSSLDEGIAALDSFAATPFAEPAPVGDTDVPIDALVYRGRAAVERAIWLREQIRQSGSAPSPEVLGELFELLDLALSE